MHHFFTLPRPISEPFDETGARRDSGLEEPSPHYSRIKPTGPVILGISGTWHDSTAAIFRGGVLFAALEEERMTRRKHDTSQIPVNAVNRLLKSCDLQWEEIDHIAIGWDYNLYEETPHGKPPGTAVFEQIHEDYAALHHIPVEDLHRRDVFERNRDRFRPAVIEAILGRMANERGSKYQPPVTFVSHHWAHAASAYYASGFTEPTVVLTLDGYGDTETTTVWLGHDRDLTLLDSISLPNSLGWVYSAITEYLGFRPLNSEGEVMGLAPFGAPRNRLEEALVNSLRSFMNDFVSLDPNGRFRVNPSFVYFGDFPKGSIRVSQALIDRLRPLVPPVEPGYRVDPDRQSDRCWANLAFSLQERIEQAILHLVSHYLRDDPRTLSARHVALAGGVALNIKANSELITHGLVRPEHLFVQPAAGDSGAALGAGMVVARKIYDVDPRFCMRKIDLGTAYTDEEILVTLNAFGLVADCDYRVLPSDEAVAAQTAELLACNKVVAWFQGGSEIGPRALGYRSILLNPADTHANATANRIKAREWWRPSALSITIEAAVAFLEGFDAESVSPFMNLAFDVTEQKRHTIMSGLHLADGSSRPQTVTRDDHPLLWEVLHSLGQKTGVPAVVNTSFNVSEPIVESPEEALNSFAYMKEVDALVLGRLIITSRKNLTPSVRWLAAEPATRNLLRVAINSGNMNDWDRVFTAASSWLADSLRVAATLSDRFGRRRQLEWPLVREFFDERTAEQLYRYLGAAIYNDALEFGAAEVRIGSTSEKYDRVVFETLALSLRSLSDRLAEFANFGELVEVSRLSTESLRSTAESEPRPTVFRVMFESWV